MENKRILMYESHGEYKLWYSIQTFFHLLSNNNNNNNNNNGIYIALLQLILIIALYNKTCKIIINVI